MLVKDEFTLYKTTPLMDLTRSAFRYTDTLKSFTIDFMNTSENLYRG